MRTELPSLLFKRTLLAFVRAYRYALSPLLPPACRFEPTCSAYALEAIETHGPLKGLRLTFQRLLKCHPFHPGGFDPVPSRKPESPCAHSR